MDRLVRALVLLSLWLWSASATHAALELHVVSEGGRALEGARVSLWKSRADARPLATGLSDKRGRVRLAIDDLADECLLSVSHPRHPRTTRRLGPGRAGTLEVELPAGGTRPLRVLDALSGRLVPTFRALVLPADGFAGERAFLAEGLFVREIEQSADALAQLEGLGGEPAALLLHSPRHALQVLPLEPTSAGELVAHLEDDSCRELSLYSEITGAPVADARLAGSAQMLEGSLERLALWSSSDAAGRVLYCPPSGTSELHVRHPEHAPLRLQLSELLTTSRITLREAARLSGRVVDRDSRPVPQARITLRSAQGAYHARSGPAGSFEVEGLPRDLLELEVRAGRRSDPASLTKRLDLSARAREHVLLELRSAPRIELVDSSGEPLPEATLVSVVDDRPVAEARADAEGRAALPRCDESGALVALREDSSLYFDATSAPRRGERLRRLRVPAALVSGRVLDARGQPIAGALVSCAPRQASLRRASSPGPLWLASRGESVVARGAASLAASGPRGEFSLRRPSWCRALEVQGAPKAQGAPAPRRTRVSLPSKPGVVEIRLRDGFAARARVSSGQGASAPGGRIELRRASSTTPRGEFLLVAGEASVELDDAGPWTLIARVDSFAPALSPPFLAREGEELEISLSVERGAFMLIDVEGAWPSREGTAVLDAGDRDWSKVAEAHPAGEGQLLLGPLPLGEYRVGYARGWARARLRIEGQVVEVSRPAR